MGVLALWHCRKGSGLPALGTCISTQRTHAYTHYLDTALKQEPWHGEALFFIEWFAEDDDLLEEENPPLFAARQKSCILVCDQESVLKEQLTLGDDFTLKRVEGGKGRGEENVAV